MDEKVLDTADVTEGSALLAAEQEAGVSTRLEREPQPGCDVTVVQRAQEGDKEATKTEKQSLMAMLKSMNLDYKEVLGAVGWEEGQTLTKKQYVQVLANLRQ